MVLGYGVGHWYVSFYDKSGRHFPTMISLTPLFLFCTVHHSPYTTKMAQVLCPGCNKRVSLKGLAGHLRKTQNVRCRTVQHALQAPGSIPGTASSLASIPNASCSFSVENFLESGANQWRQNEADISMHTQEGKLAATRFRSKNQC
jgi:hypothetical protein